MTRPVTVTAVAGHSLGEYTALVAAGVLTAADGARLVGERGEAMQAAADAQPGTMAAVLGLDPEGVAKACDGVDGAWVANDNAPGQIVIAGTAAGVEAAGQRAKDLGAKRVMPLPVGGRVPLAVDGAGPGPARRGVGRGRVRARRGRGRGQRGRPRSRRRRRLVRPAVSSAVPAGPMAGVPAPALRARRHPLPRAGPGHRAVRDGQADRRRRRPEPTSPAPTIWPPPSPAWPAAPAAEDRRCPPWPRAGLEHSLPWYFGVAVFVVWAGLMVALGYLVRRRLRGPAERRASSAPGRPGQAGPGRPRPSDRAPTSRSGSAGAQVGDRGVLLDRASGR